MKWILSVYVCVCVFLLLMYLSDYILLNLFFYLFAFVLIWLCFFCFCVLFFLFGLMLKKSYFSNKIRYFCFLSVCECFALIHVLEGMSINVVVCMEMDIVLSFSFFFLNELHGLVAVVFLCDNLFCLQIAKM